MTQHLLKLSPQKFSLLQLALSGCAQNFGLFFIDLKAKSFFLCLSFLVCINVSFATPQIELDKQSCRWFYRPDNTYSINYQYDIYNKSTNGESLTNIQVKDDLVATFGAAHRIVSAGIYAIWTYNMIGGSAAPSGSWDWNWSNIQNWNGTSTVNMLNDGSPGDGETIQNLTLLPGGVIHYEVCIIVKADDLPAGIGNDNNWTNTLAFVSARSGSTDLNTSNIVNIQTTSITNEVTVAPYRNRSILTLGVRNNLPEPNNSYPALALDGTWSFDYYVRIQQHPNTVTNPDGPSAATANNLYMHFGLENFYNNGIPIQSVSVTKEYGPASFVPNPNFTGNATTIGGVPVTADDNLVAAGVGMALNEVALLKLHVVVGPSANNLNNTMYFNSWAEFDDASGRYQGGIPSQQDTINDPFSQCNCWGWGLKLDYKAKINVEKTVLSNTCSPGLVNKMDVEYEFNISADPTNNVWLNELQLLDDLNTNSCGSFLSVVSPPSIFSSTATVVPSTNAAYNGISDTDLFTGSQNDKLAPSENIVVRMKARYDVTAMCSPSQFNDVSVVSKDPPNVSVSDVSGSVLIPITDCSAPPCILPDFVLTPTAPTCSGATANNDGKITLTAANNADKYGVSTGATYAGPDYANASTIALPQDVQTAIPNAGGSYTIRLFNGENDCFKDTTIVIAPVSCSAPCTSTTSDICPGDTYLLDAGTGLASIQWFKDNAAISGANAQTYLVTEVGSYHFTANLSSTGCNAQGCCPAIFFAGNCTVPCPPKICLPVTITRN